MQTETLGPPLVSDAETSDGGAFLRIHRATMAARERTGDRTVSTRVKQGRIQIVRVTYGPRGKSTITPVSDWVSFGAAVTFLDAL